MKAKDLKKRIDAIAADYPDMNIVVKVEAGDGSYSVSDIESVSYGEFNGLYFIEPEVHTGPNCAILNCSDIPSPEMEPESQPEGLPECLTNERIMAIALSLFSK